MVCNSTDYSSEYFAGRPSKRSHYILYERASQSPPEWALSIKCYFIYTQQEPSKNAQTATHIKGRLPDQVVFLQSRSFSKRGLLLKERICSQRERILSFKSSFLWYGKSLLPHKISSLECYYYAHARIQDFFRGRGVQAWRPENNLFFSPQLIKSLQRGSRGFMTEKTLLFQRSRGSPAFSRGGGF